MATTRARSFSRLAYVVVAAILCHMTGAAYDRTVCDMDAFKQQAANNTGATKPRLASQYRLRVEANLKEANHTVDAHEFYDSVHNRGAVHQWDTGVETQVIYDFTAGQLITVTFPDRADPTQHVTRCEVRALSTVNQSMVFGDHTYTNGSQHIYNVGDALRMAADQPSVYLGQVVREDDVIAQAWRACVYLPSLDATFNATWYFTANNTWTSTMGPQVQAPLSLHVAGRVAGAHAHDFDHVYSFSDYRPGFDDDTYSSKAFVTPQGVACAHRVNTMALPNTTDNFSFSSEIVDAGTQHITYLSEFYDYEMRVMRYELQSLKGSVYGTNPLSRVHDFNTGVAYTTDRVRGNCTATPITTLGFDSESVDSAFVRMRTSQSFFDLTDRKYTYTGQRTVRDIECDTWITVKDDWPPSQPFETHWEWYFATRSWMESVGYQYEVRLPVQLRITAQNFAPPFERIFNLYNYKEDQNNPWDFSISACFNSSHRKEYTLTIPGNYSQYVGVDQSNFQFFFTLALTAHAQVSALRVANVKFDFDDVNIYASFSLLDKAPITGDVQDAEPEMDLTQASSAMEADITSGTFFIELQLHNNGVKLQVTKFTVGVAPNLQPAPPPPPPPQQHHHHQQRQRLEDNTASRRPQLLQHEEQRQRRATRRGAGDEGLGLDVKTAAPQDTSSTYSAGAMAGLGIPMVIIGYGLAFIVTLLTYRRVTARHTLDVDNLLTEIRPSAAQLR